ncbi:MAG TPA: hypothetical protein VKA67_12490, partial [Verrucomicrobiae bacterium]|nr:hypothetical protein [Verrucomicrobiae bacterium]
HRINDRRDDQNTNHKTPNRRQVCEKAGFQQEPKRERQDQRVPQVNAIRNIRHPLEYPVPDKPVCSSNTLVKVEDAGPISKSEFINAKSETLSEEFLHIPRGDGQAKKQLSLKGRNPPPDRLLFKLMD